MSEENGVKISKDALELIEEHGLEAAEIEGTGKDGAIGIGDVRDHLEALANDGDEGEDGDEDDQADAPDEGDDKPEEKVKKGHATCRFKHNGDKFEKGDKYEGKDAKELRKKGLIA